MITEDRISAIEAEVSRLATEYAALQATVLPATENVRQDLTLSLKYYDEAIQTLRSRIGTEGGASEEVVLTMFKELLKAEKAILEIVFDRIAAVEKCVAKLTDIVGKMIS